MSQITHPGELNDKQRAFCHEYLLDFNGTQAAIRAGYSKRTAGSQGQRLLTNVEIQKYLAKLKAEVRERSNISTERIIEEYASIAFARLTDFVSLQGNAIKVKNFDELTDDQKAVISEISQRSDFFKVKLHDKIRALDSLSKIFGLFDGIDEGITKEFIRSKALEAGLDPDMMIAQVFDFNTEFKKRRRV